VWSVRVAFLRWEHNNVLCACCCWVHCQPYKILGVAQFIYGKFTSAVAMKITRASFWEQLYPSDFFFLFFYHCLISDEPRNFASHLLPPSSKESTWSGGPLRATLGHRLVTENSSKGSIKVCVFLTWRRKHSRLPKCHATSKIEQETKSEKKIICQWVIHHRHSPMQ
jgi:hypothetical protein